MILRIYNCITLTILNFLFSYSLGFAQNGKIGVQDLYEKTNEVWKILEEGNTVTSLRICDETIDKYQDKPYSGKYLGYLRNYQGESFFRLGDLGLARNCYLLGINNAHAELDRNLESTLRINLAATYHEARDFKSCLRLSKLIYQDSTLRLSEDQKGMLLNNMSISSTELNDLGEADSLFSILFLHMKSRTIDREFDSLLTYRNYGRYLLKKGLKSAAKTYFIEALIGYQRKVGDQHYQTANSWKYLGNCYEAQKQLDSALICYTNAARILAPDLKQLNLQLQNYRQTNYETIYLDALLRKASLLQKKSDTAISKDKIAYLMQAYRTFQEAIARIDYLMRSYLFTESGFILADKVREIFNGAIGTAVQLAEVTKEKGYSDKAFIWTIESKSISLYISALLQIEPSKDIALTHLQAKYYILRASLEQVRRALLKKPEARLTDSLRYWTQKIVELKNSIQSALINPVYPSELQLLDLFRPANFRTRSYLAFHEYDTCFLVFGVNRHHRFYKVIPKDEELQDSINNFKRILSQPLTGYYSEEQFYNFTILSNYLYNHLIQPLNAEIRTSKLLIHPDGILLGFPFEILLTEIPTFSSGTMPLTFRNLPYLTNKFTISYISLPIQKPTGNSKIVEKDSLALIVDGSDPQLHAVQNESRIICKDFIAVRIIHEDSIKQIFNTLENVPIIHFAGHVAMDSINPYQSTIMKNLDWGVIINSRLNNKLVFINGCESGLGPFNHGEGLMSPGYAFALAGSPSVIENLWIASDKAASSIASNFYDHVFENEVPEALQLAKAEYLKKCPTGMSHPHYWAGMICYEYLPNESRNPLILIIFFGLAIIIVEIILCKKMAK